MDNAQLSIAHPTDGQIEALGLLAINSEVWVSWTISRDDLRKLEALGLCTADHELDRLMTDTVKWVGTDKLAALLPPYTKLVQTYRQADVYLDAYKMRIHPYWKSTSYYDGKPEGIDERDQIELVKTANECREFMMAICKDIGRGLASHWLRWLHDTMQDNDE